MEMEHILLDDVEFIEAVNTSIILDFYLLYLLVGACRFFARDNDRY